jgi:hypothetical protein
MKWITFHLTAILTLTAVAPQLHVDAPDPAPKDTFSIIALPDTQAYAANDPKIFNTITQWIVDHQADQRIAFVSHVGDIVNDNVPKEWAVAVQAMAKLDGKIPYAFSVGNHDMKCADGDAALFSASFPADHYKDNTWYGGQIKNNADSFQRFEVQGLKFLILHLECNAPDNVLAWADQVIADHADRRVIITTHMFLGPLDRPKDARAWHDAPKGVMKWQKCHRDAGNTPQQLWEKSFQKHKNLFLILCGDQSRSQAMHLPLKGKHGNTVHACLSDYREGYFRIYRFTPNKNEIRVMTFSPTLNELCTGTQLVPDEAKHQFTFNYDMTP